MIEPIFQTALVGIFAIVASFATLFLVVPRLSGDGREAERLAKMAADEAARHHPAE